MLELVNAKEEAGDRDWLANVYPFYLHDLSEFENEYYTLTETGNWAPDHLPDWLGEPLQFPFVIHVDGEKVGFVFVARRPFPYMVPEADYRLCEFFILKRHRRRGLGTRAATAVFERFPGTWEVTELPRNRPAIAFWRKVIGDHTNGVYRETQESGEVRQLFTSRAGALSR